MNFEEAFNIGSIQLEPRLQEYIRRKKFNRENNIDPDIQEEKEFGITKHDLKTIKTYKRGKKGRAYSSKRLAKNPDFIEPAKGSFESDFGGGKNAFKNDPRYQRLARKMASHKKARQQITNFDGIDEDYEIFHRSNPYDLKPEKRPQRIAKPFDDPQNYQYSSDDGEYDDFDDSFMMDSRDFVLGPSRECNRKSRKNLEAYENSRNPHLYNPNQRSSRGDRSHTYHNKPNISYRNRLIHQKVNGGLDHNHSTEDIIGRLDEYNQHLQGTYEYMDDEVDQDTHTYRGKTRSKTQREQYNGYKPVPFMYGNGLPDVSVEDALRGGFRDSSKKSIGFKNTFEHNFDYIDQDISDHRHTVHMWPQNTRGANKEVARPYSNAVRSANLMAQERNKDPVRRHTTNY